MTKRNKTTTKTTLQKT